MNSAIVTSKEEVCDKKTILSEVQFLIIKNLKLQQYYIYINYYQLITIIDFILLLAVARSFVRLEMDYIYENVLNGTIRNYYIAIIQNLF